MKKAVIITGFAVAAIGALIALGAISFTDTEEVLRVGEAAVSVETERQPSRTLGYVLLVAGAAVGAGGLAMRRR